jgi:two-component system response regulator FixJ
MSRVEPPTVFIVDDDLDIRKALQWLVESVRLRAETYASAQQFLDTYPPERPGCLVVDLRMPGMSGLELIDELRSRGIALPSIVLTGHGNVSTAVHAMKAGAVDFIEKPYADQELLDLINQALKLDARLRHKVTQHAAITTRISRLTAREHEVLRRLVSGQANKVISAELDISEKTVEAHRRRIMKKMEARSFAHLVRMALLHSPDWGNP